MDENVMLELASTLPTENSFGPLDEYDVTQEDMMAHMQIMRFIQQATDSVIGHTPDVDMLPNLHDDALMRLIDAVPLE